MFAGAAHCPHHVPNERAPCSFRTSLPAAGRRSCAFIRFVSERKSGISTIFHCPFCNSLLCELSPLLQRYKHYEFASSGDSYDCMYRFERCSSEKKFLELVLVTGLRNGRTTRGQISVFVEISAQRTIPHSR